MKLDILRKLIREEIRNAIKEELKEILTEAVIIASEPKPSSIHSIPERQGISNTIQPYTQIKPNPKPRLSEIMAEQKPLTSTGNPILDLLNETANSNEWRTLNMNYTAQDAVNWSGGIPNMEGANTPVVSTVNQMISTQGPVRDINDVKIDVVPDFTGLMNKFKEKGKL